MRLGPFTDASGTTLTLPAPARRIVSLIPSVTETLFTLGRGEAVAGCTMHCTEPAEGVATRTRVGGEKNPKLEVIRDLAPDLVIANIEENLREHVERLRAWGIPVYVSYPRTAAEAVWWIRELGRLTGAEARAEGIAVECEARLGRVRARLGGRRKTPVFCPIWRKPYMSINRDTYIHDVLATCGGDNVFAGAAKRYPEVTLEQVARARPEVILLPDEPYRFRRAHLADFAPLREVPAVREGRIHLLDGKLLAWFGPRLGEALDVLPPLLA